MAVAYYNRGTRFVEVDDAGEMTEIGWITPAEGYTGSTQWISDDVVYLMDYRRGLEVVRRKAADATGTVTNDEDMIAAGSTLELPVSPFTGTNLALGAFALLALGLVRIERVVRRSEGRLAVV